MKPTRNIVTPTKGLWLAKRRVWFQKNDDSKMTRAQVRKMYREQLKEWDPKPTKAERKGHMELADMSYAENEGSE